MWLLFYLIHKWLKSNIIYHKRHKHIVFKVHYIDWIWFDLVNTFEYSEYLTCSEKWSVNHRLPKNCRWINSLLTLWFKSLRSRCTFLKSLRSHLQISQIPNHQTRGRKKIEWRIHGLLGIKLWGQQIVRINRRGKDGWLITRVGSSPLLCLVILNRSLRLFSISLIYNYLLRFSLFFYFWS